MKTYSPSYITLSGILSYLFFLMVILLFTFSLPSELENLAGNGEQEKVLENSESLQKYLITHKATLTDSRKINRIQKLLSINLPGDLGTRDHLTKSNLFISLVLPNIIMANETILHTREKLIQLKLNNRSSKELSTRDARWLQQLARQYSCEAEFAPLLQRVDIIPVSLAMAQAITESGWGTSRFALEGNALYGQHLPQKSNASFILSRQGQVKVAAFDSLYEATMSYMHNLNTSRAYKRLRELREQQRQKQLHPDGYIIAAGLQFYSALGGEYIHIIQSIIGKYELRSLDQLVLSRNTPRVQLRFLRPPGS